MMLTNNVICTFCLAKCIRKGGGGEIVPFDYMTFKKIVICTFCLTKCIRKGQKNCSFWLHEEWLSSQKEHFFGSFLNVIFLEKKVICTFCLAKCIRKRKKNCSFWLHEVKKERHLYFLPSQMHQKRTNNCSFWLHDVQKERYLYF